MTTMNRAERDYMTNDSPIEINLSKNPNASIIWMHGLGADGNDFVPVVEMLNLPQFRFILPHAPYRAVTVNNGYEMRAWYDIFSFTPGSPQDETGIRQSQAYIESLIAREIDRGIAPNKVLLAGFSQGGAIALHTGLRHKQALAGIMALSTYLPLQPLLATEKTAENQHTPIYMAHGTYDEVISLATCRLSVETLQAQAYALEWHEYPMAHSVCVEEIDDIRTFLLRVLKD
jgi:phospholipase/carboxylesterase